MSRKGGVIAGVVLLVLLLIGAVVYYRGVGGKTPVVQWAADRLHTRVNFRFAQKEDKADNEPDLYKAIAVFHDNRTENSYLHNAIDHDLKPCPDQQSVDGGKISMDLSACPSGQGVIIPFPKKNLEGTYKVAYFTKDDKGAIHQEEPNIVLVYLKSDDDFSEATKQGPNLYLLRGDVKLVAGKGALSITLERQ